MYKFFLACLFFFSISAASQSTTPQSFDIGSPLLQEIWIDHQLGDDSNTGDSEAQALKTIRAAWNRIPANTTLTIGYHLKIKSGNYPDASLPNYWENRRGTLLRPIILEAVDGAGTVTLERDINAFNLHYFYLIGLNIITSGDSFHCEQCDSTLLRKVILDGGEQEAHETLKMNQSKNFYLENSIIRGAEDNAIDLVAVQNGHILNNRISNAGDWCIYVKGGSAYITIAGNEIFDCGTGGFTAGQGTGLEFMENPWLHYEAYDLKVFNNVIHDTDGAGLGVNGGYNILLSFNTLYNIGQRSHLVEFVFGERSCDGNNTACNNRVAAGGWGPVSNTIAPQPIPNKNIFFLNNIIYNPPGIESAWQHLAVLGPRTANAGSNIPNPVKSDQNLIIKNNIFWNGSPSMPLGIGGSDGCRNDNPDCNEAQLFRDNYINTVEPQLINPSVNDFRPELNGNLFTIPPFTQPEFSGGDRISIPLAPAGNLNNQISIDRGGTTRTSSGAIGAYSLSSSSLQPELPVDPQRPEVLEITNFRISKRKVLRNEIVRVSCRLTGQASSLYLSVGSTINKQLRLKNGIFRVKFKIRQRGRYNLILMAQNPRMENSLNAGYLRVRKHKITSN